MLHPEPSRTIHVPPEMIVALAQGIDPPLEIAARYGFDADEFAQLQRTPWFAREVEAVTRAWRSGDLRRRRHELMADDIIQDYYVHAKASDSISVKADAARFFARLADFEPKQGLAAAGGAPLHLSIVVNGQSVVEVRRAPVVEGQAEPASAGASEDAPPRSDEPSGPPTDEDFDRALAGAPPALPIPAFDLGSLAPGDALRALDQWRPAAPRDE